MTTNLVGSSPGVDAIDGTPESGVTIDYDGDARQIGGAYDMGADEYSP